MKETHCQKAWLSIRELLSRLRSMTPQERARRLRERAMQELGRRPEYPKIHTTRSGARYVRPIDILRSKAGRRELDLQLESAKRRRS